MTIRRLQARDARCEVHQLHIDVADDHRVGELEAELEAAGFACTPLTVDGRRLDAVERVGDLGLEHGCTIDDGTTRQVSTLVPHGTNLVVVAGPDAGAVLPLRVGERITVGRGNDSTLVIDDPLLSAQHVEIFLVEESRAILSDSNSTNGTAVELEYLTEPTEVLVGEFIHIGSTVITLEHSTPEDIAVLGQPVEGERAFPRQFRSAHPELPRSIDAPRAPSDEDDSAGGMWWRSLLPVVTGVGFAFITGRFIFLAIIIISPIIMTVESLRRRKKRKSKSARERREYDAALVDFKANVTSTRSSERRRRRDDALCGGSAALLSQSRHRRLWERTAADPDFVHVAVGLAALPSDVDVRNGDEWFSPEQWGTPLQHDLLNTGSLAIVGPVERARSVARNVLVNLAATHSPADVRIWLLTDDDHGSDWDFVRRLPHTVGRGHTSTISVGAADRSRAVRVLRSVVESRREAGNDRQISLPVHVIVVDGCSSIAAADLAELVGVGPTIGVAAISLDAMVVPEGAGGTLRLGKNADEATFVSRTQPPLDEVIVTELSASTAAAAVLPMAPLRPTLTLDSAGLGGTVHLVDLEPAVNLDADGLRRRWSAVSPVTSVVVGAASDGPMMVDIVGDGPHGLIGGTSGSGKTEFLKTMFISLCAQNHPDDLSIVVVDFKGGVDHEAIRPLPHVIDVATNLDIDQFKRTLELLTAEQMRRQDMLSSVGASNVTAYRAARERDPSLPPMPRLLVVVDEFGELLSNPDGKEQLKKLESITRIGRALGLHLLLVTQNFESSLPPQIDANAGLRISLRVQKPGHSKIVLDSDAAAFIPDDRIGRGFARFHGRDLLEFQTARVAGRRKDLVAMASDISIREVTFSELGAPVREATIEDVPADETDMHSIIERIREAVARTGWTTSSVPWPSPLPSSVSLTALARRQPPGQVAIGLEDHPELQARGLTLISPDDDQIAVIGGADADVPGVLAMYATSVALSSSADDLHVYVLDLLGRGMSPLGELPHTGAVVVRDDGLALRIIRWLSEVASERRALLAASGASTMAEHVGLGNSAPPQLLFMINGADRLFGTESAHLQLNAPLLRLLGDAIGVRIQVVLGGGVRLATHKLGLNVTRRIVLELNDRGDYSTVGVPKQFASDLETHRRAVDASSGRLTQLARLAAPGGIEGDVIRQLASTLPAATNRPPRKFAALTWPLPLAVAHLDRASPPDGYEAPLPVGLDAETAEWTWLDMTDDGPLLAITGSAKSGKSLTLAFLARMAAHRGHPVVNVVLSKRSPLSVLDVPWASTCELDGIEAAAASVRGKRPVIIVDDINRIEDSAVLAPLLAESLDGFVIVTGPSDTFSARMGVMRGLPSIGAGLLLAPQSALDGSAFGLRRLSDEILSESRPGKGVLALAGEATPIQIPTLDESS